MAKLTRGAAKAAAALTSKIVEIFGGPPLLSTEDAGAYDDLRFTPVTSSRVC